VEFWRDVPETTPNYPWDALIPKTKRETRQLLKRGEKLRITVGRSSSFIGMGSILGALTRGDAKFLSVTPLGSYEPWNVLASDVKVTCIPKDTDFVKQYFAWLPELDWEPE